MKRIFWAIALIISMTFVSCGSQTNQSNGNDSIDTVTVDTIDVDSVVTDTL